MCSVCDVKGHSAKICASIFTIFACEAGASSSDSDGVLSGKKQETLVCNVPGKFFDEPGKTGGNAPAWQMGDLSVICGYHAYGKR